MAKHFWCAAAVLVLTASASAQMRITEYMYNGGGSGASQNREFVEFTNIGASPVDMTGWSFDDSSRTPGSLDLSTFGTVQPHQSVIVAEQSASVFLADWGLSGVSVIGNNTQNLGRADEINLYDNSSALIDRLTYDDQTINGTIRTNGISGWTTPPYLGMNDITHWQLSVLNDAQHSYLSSNGNLGNPGTYVPEPATLCLLMLGGLGLRSRRRGA